MDASESGKLGYEKVKATLDAFRDEQMIKAIQRYSANPKFCLYCGKEISYEKRRTTFCSRSCATSFRQKSAPNRRSKICQCGNEKKPSNKYCSDCAEKHVYLRPQSVELLKDSVAIKRLLVEKRGHRCEDCGLSEWKSHPIPLEMHHIDGDSDNNTAENLKLVCPNCHAFTPHYKGAVKGKNGSRQKMRRKRYANGETW
jgi:hypothetical protein